MVKCSKEGEFMQNNIINKRDYLFDNLKALLIFLVVLGHCIGAYVYKSNLLKSLYFFIYLFHMPLFVFISGYYSKNIEKCKKNAVNNIAIPYIIFNTIWYIFISMMTKGIVFSFANPGWTLWYLLSLFCWRISLKYLIKIKYIIPISIIGSILVGCIDIYEFSISRTIALLPFFLLGYYCDKNTIDNIKKIKSRYCYLALIMIFLASFYIAHRFNIDVSFLHNSEAYSYFNLNICIGMLFRAILFITATILSISIINIISSKKTRYSQIGKNSLTVYLLHIYPIKILLHEFIMPWELDALSIILILLSSAIITTTLSNNIVQKLYNNTFGKLKIKDKKILIKIKG